MRDIIRQITDPLGFHLQLAVLLSSEAKRWQSKVTFESDGRMADAKDLMSLLAMGIRTGEAVVVHVEGADEQTAAGAIDRLSKHW